MDFPDAPLLQAIWQSALWSQRSNFFSVPTDCPQRDERMGWMGDIQVFLDAAAFTMEVDPFIRRFLREARAAQRADGARSEEHTSELQSLMRISYAVFCL